MAPTILLADISKTIQQAAEMILTKEGFRPCFANNAQELLKKAQSDQPQVILIAHQLPGSDLSDTINSLRGLKELSTIPLIVLGSSKGSVNAELTLEKPFSCQGLLDSLAKAQKLIPSAPPKAAGSRKKAPVTPTALSKEETEAIIRETVERIVWEVVPKLAETIIKEEIERLLKNT